MNEDGTYQCLSDGVGESVVYASGIFNWDLRPINNMDLIVEAYANDRKDSAEEDGNSGKATNSMTRVGNIEAEVQWVNGYSIPDFTGDKQVVNGDTVEISVRVWPEPIGGAEVELWFRYDNDCYPGGADVNYDGFPDNGDVMDSRGDGIDNDWDEDIDESQTDANANNVGWAEVNIWQRADTTGGKTMTATNESKNWFEVSLQWDVSMLANGSHYEFAPVVVDYLDHGVEFKYADLPWTYTDTDFPQGGGTWHKITIQGNEPKVPEVIDDGYYTNSTTQLHASWTSSGIGIVEYMYAIGTTPGGNEVVDWTSASGNTDVVVSGLDLENGKTYYFSAKARSSSDQWSDAGISDGVVVDILAQEMEIALYRGWNLICLGLDIGETDLLKILKQIEEYCRSVWTYNSNPGWECYFYDGTNNANQLNSIIPGKGYWLDMTDDAVLRLIGKKITGITLSAYKGWNLMGNVFSEPTNAEDAILPDGIFICTYDSEIEDWVMYKPGSPDFANTIKQFKPGKGYWVYVEEDQVIIIP